MSDAGYKRINKHIGPGGLKCPCCNPFGFKGSLKNAKQKLNRFFRRKNKKIEECPE